MGNSPCVSSKQRANQTEHGNALVPPQPNELPPLSYRACLECYEMAEEKYEKKIIRDGERTCEVEEA
jgi:hypothetical protein